MAHGCVRVGGAATHGRPSSSAVQGHHELDANAGRTPARTAHTERLRQLYREDVIRDVEVREAGDKGVGVYALRSFDEGEFVFRRRHRRTVTAGELDGLCEWDRVHLCELGFDRFAILEPPGCYLNHSCDPNAMRHGVTVFAWRPIHAGDEITIDYRLNAFDGDSWPCHCGTSNCTGTVVGSFFAMDADRQRLLLPHAPRFIRSEYRRRARSTLR